MALSNEEIVRLLCGDTQEPYILTSNQVAYYLTINSDDTTAAANDAKAAIVQILAVRAAEIRTEDLYEDTTDAPQAYIDSIEKSNSLASRSAYPIIGGADSYPGPTVNQFDEENDYDDEDSFYNGYEDI